MPIRNLLVSLVLLSGILAQEASAQVRINEIGVGIDFNGTDKWIELYNTGSSTIQVDTMQLCNWPDYNFISDLTVLSGNTNLAAGEYVVVAWSLITPGSSEVGLYNAAPNGFGVAANMLDYLEYGASGFVRESVAEEAGLWTAGEFVAFPEEGRTMSYFDFPPTRLEKWRQGQPTPGLANQSPTTLESPVSVNDVSARVYPNPFTEYATIQVVGAERSSATLRILDALGRTVASYPSVALNPGETKEFEVSSFGIPAGIYLYHVTFDGLSGKTTTAGTFTRVD